MSESTISGVVLAAGTSSRLTGDTPKQLLKVAGVPLVRRAVRTALASRLGEVVVVLGHAAPAVADAIADLGAATVLNPDYDSGQSTSVRAGLARVDSEAAAAIFIPADQPLLSSGLIDRLIAAYRETGSPIVGPAYGGRRGAPVLFDRELFFELEQLTGDTGGRAVLARYASSITEVAVEDPDELADVDTEADLRRLRDARREAS